MEFAEPSYAIYIPTRGRVGRQVTREYFPASTLVVPVDELQAYQAEPGSMLACPREIDGISATRQWILETATEDYVIMMDDDLRFYTWEDMDNPVKLVKFDDVPTLAECLYQVILAIRAAKVIHATIGPRMFAPERIKRGERYWRYVVKANNVHIYDRTRVLEEMNGGDSGNTFSFMDVKLMEDYHVTLSLLRRGYHNLEYNGMVWNQDQSGMRGGCSEYRDEAMQAQAAHQLKELHDQFVTVERKHSSSARGAMSTRTDVKINWRKAYESFNFKGSRAAN